MLRTRHTMQPLTRATTGKNIGRKKMPQSPLIIGKDYLTSKFYLYRKLEFEHYLVFCTTIKDKTP
jgi:hypothetical protein